MENSKHDFCVEKSDIGVHMIWWFKNQETCHQRKQFNPRFQSIHQIWFHWSHKIIGQEHINWSERMHDNNTKRKTNSTFKLQPINEHIKKKENQETHKFIQFSAPLQIPLDFVDPLLTPALKPETHTRMIDHPIEIAPSLPLMRSC